MASHLRASPAPEAEAHVLAHLLLSELESWPIAAWLVIDDYHRAALSEASELFIDVLASSDACRVLLLTRKRPSWATARRRLYGEILEIDRTLLTMTPAEATAILPTRNPSETSRLLEGSKGWPAIIGLAALTNAKRSAAPLPLSRDLYDYFAEDVPLAVEFGRRSIADDYAVTTIAASSVRVDWKVRSRSLSMATQSLARSW
jgi:ATP/maltotriose-dependent transcriptional regulator MalT